jgi:hypothetical protein
MSHFVTINTEIKDIEALRLACAEMNLALLDDTEARGFGATRRHGEHVIRLNGPFDIALTKNETGRYNLSTDWWEGHVEKEVGKDFGRLLQLYAVHKATKEARQRGLLVQRKNRQDGSIKLMIGGI